MKELFKGLEEARKEFNDWQGQAAIFVDFDSMEAWCRVEEIPSYHSDKIFPLVGKDSLYERNDRYGKDRLNGIAQSLINMKESGKYTNDEIRLNFYELAAEAFYNGSVVTF